MLVLIYIKLLKLLIGGVPTIIVNVGFIKIYLHILWIKIFQNSVHNAKLSLLCLFYLELKFFILFENQNIKDLMLVHYNDYILHEYNLRLVFEVL